MSKKFKTLLGYQNAKTSKGEDLGYLTGIMYLAPADIVKGLNLCPSASKGCKAACLYSAGRGKFNNVQTARIKKTELFRDDFEHFFKSLIWDIEKAAKRSKNKGLKLCIRLNGTSDIMWENIRSPLTGLNIFEKIDQSIEDIKKQLPIVAEKIRLFENTFLTNDQCLELADNVCQFVLPDKKIDYCVKSALKTRRLADNTNSLWHVFNRLQESSLRGGIQYQTLGIQTIDNCKEWVVKNHINRRVKSIDKQVKINKALWDMAEKIAA